MHRTVRRVSLEDTSRTYAKERKDDVYSTLCWPYRSSKLGTTVIESNHCISMALGGERRSTAGWASAFSYSGHFPASWSRDEVCQRVLIVIKRSRALWSVKVRRTSPDHPSLFEPPPARLTPHHEPCFLTQTWLDIRRSMGDFVQLQVELSRRTPALGSPTHTQSQVSRAPDVPRVVTQSQVGATYRRKASWTGLVAVWVAGPPKGDVLRLSASGRPDS